MTRKGKIARLPDNIREQLNSRLHEAEEGKSILAWLNSLPQVQSVLASLFDGRLVNAVNLTKWKQGGYRDWLVRQDALEFAKALQDEITLGHERANNASDASLVHWVAIHYAAVAKALVTNELDPRTKWSRLRELCADATCMQRAQLAAERLANDDYWISREEAKALQKLKDHVASSNLPPSLF